MPEDGEDYVATEFHGLVSDLQHNDVRRFEEGQKQQAEQRAALRRSNPYQGLNAGELLKALDGDQEASDKKVQDELARIEQEAKAAVDKSKTVKDPLPDGHFPPPPDTE